MTFSLSFHTWKGHCHVVFIDLPGRKKTEARTTNSVISLKILTYCLSALWLQVRTWILANLGRKGIYWLYEGELTESKEYE